MIDRIDIRDADIAARILELQRESYALEAALIGFDGIPMLHESLEALRGSPDTFYAFRIDGRIAGALSSERAGDMLTICRLVVDPGSFRRGIGRGLVEHVMAEHADASVFEVSTGTRNTPAVSLYRSLGFEEIGRREIAPAVFVTRFEKRVARKVL
ncbi:Acetyltransferase [Minicystis rosea]|nr:Acetyltransferase [Minicystis rosea]